MNFEELKREWVSRKAVETAANGQSDASLHERLRKLQAKTVFTNLFISLSFALVFVAVGAVWSRHAGQSLAFDMGTLILFVDMLVALGFFWAMVLQWRGRAFQLSSVVFLARAIKKLEYRKKVAYVFVPVYILTLALGVNLVYLHLIAELATPVRMLIHYGLTAALLLVMVLGVYMQKRKIRKEIEPLLSELKTLRQNLLDQE